MDFKNKFEVIKHRGSTPLNSWEEEAFSAESGEKWAKKQGEHKGLSQWSEEWHDHPNNQSTCTKWGRDLTTLQEWQE